MECVQSSSAIFTYSPKEDIVEVTGPETSSNSPVFLSCIDEDLSVCGTGLQTSFSPRYFHCLQSSLSSLIST